MRQPAAEPQPAVDGQALRIVSERLAARAQDYGITRQRVVAVDLQPYQASTYPLYIAQLTSESGEKSRLVAKFAAVYGRHREGQAEFINLRTMSESLKTHPSLHVPYPFDYWEDVNALITEYRPGARFSAQILARAQRFASAGARGDLGRTAGQCGEWLRIYHGSTACGEGPPIDDRYLSGMHRNLGRIPERGPVSEFRKPLERAFQSAIDTLASVRAPLSVRHGDYSAANIHLDGDGICVFDLSHHAPGCIYDDLAYFLVTLDTINPYPRYWSFDRRLVRGIADAFLDGYFGPAREQRLSEDSVTMGAYLLKHLLTRCVQQRRVAAAAGPLALAVFDRFWVGIRYRELFADAIERATRRV